MQRISDLALGIAIPVHSHMAMNSVITDYLPKGPLQSMLHLLWHSRTANAQVSF